MSDESYFGPFTWPEWLSLSVGIADPDAPPATVRLTEEPPLLQRPQGDSTAYRVRYDGIEHSWHDKGWQDADYILTLLLNAEWPRVTFCWPCSKCGGSGKVRVQGGHGDWDTVSCMVCNQDESKRIVGVLGWHVVLCDIYYRKNYHV